MTRRALHRVRAPIPGSRSLFARTISSVFSTSSVKTVPIVSNPQKTQAAQTRSRHISCTSRGPHRSCQIHGLHSLDLLLARLISLQEWIKGKNCWRLKRSPEEVISDETEVCLVPANPPATQPCSHGEYSAGNGDERTIWKISPQTIVLFSNHFKHYVIRAWSKPHGAPF